MSFASPSASVARFRRVVPLVAVLLLAGAGPAAAGTTGSGDDSAEAVDRHTAEVIIADDPRVEADLGAVALISPEYGKAVTAYQETETRLADAIGTIDASVLTLKQLGDAQGRLQGELVAAQRRRLKSEIRLQAIRADLRDLAVGQYLHAGLASPVEAALDADEANRQGTRRVFVDAVQADRSAELHFLVGHLGEQASLEETSRRDLDEVQHRIDATEATLDAATATRDASSLELVGLRQQVADARLTADVVDLDFRFVNFNAYYRAAATMAAEQPTCGIRWTAVAAIARTESRHGTYGGGEVDADGNLTEPIYGIALDGSAGTAAIGDTDDGELDGDPDTDRAVGPMQFIPSTWRAVARDGNDDDEADPQNLYDATLTAAAYLCRRGPGLDTDEGLRRAFRSYNNDGAYVELVLARAHAYDAYEVPPLAPGLPSPSPAVLHPDDAPTDDEPAGEDPEAPAAGSTLPGCGSSCGD